MVPLSYRPIQLVLDQGAVFMDADDPHIDRGLEQLLGTQQFAAIEVGDEEYILAFDVAAGVNGDDITIVQLNAVLSMKSSGA